MFFPFEAVFASACSTRSFHHELLTSVKLGIKAPTLKRYEYGFFYINELCFNGSSLDRGITVTAASIWPASVRVTGLAGGAGAKVTSILNEISFNYLTNYYVREVSDI